MKRQEYNRIAISDTKFAVFSVVFVLLYLIYHLKSLFLGLISIFLILFSFPLTQIICKGIGQITYFGQLHAMVIFIVLGIAADDVFVFVEAWKQSKQFNQDLDRRMAYTFRRAARAMAVTSSTTSMAFYVNMQSSLMPIKSFGIFAGTIILINYILVIFFFPSATIIYER